MHVAALAFRVCCRGDGVCNNRGVVWCAYSDSLGGSLLALNLLGGVGRVRPGGFSHHPPASACTHACVRVCLRFPLAPFLGPRPACASLRAPCAPGGRPPAEPHSLAAAQSRSHGPALSAHIRVCCPRAATYTRITPCVVRPSVAPTQSAARRPVAGPGAFVRVQVAKLRSWVSGGRCTTLTKS